MPICTLQLTSIFEFVHFSLVLLLGNIKAPRSLLFLGALLPCFASFSVLILIS